MRYWDSILVYIGTLGGILLSDYLPFFKTGQDIRIHLHVGRLVIAAAIALVFVLQDETGFLTKEGIAPEGRKRNLRRRLSHGIAMGMAWNTIFT